MVWCPCSGRTGTLLVGILDLVIGSAGLSAVCFLLYIISKEIYNLNEDPTGQFEERLHILTGLYWSVMLAYVFPTLVTLLTGIFVIFAVSEKNDCCAIVSILLTVIMVFVCGGISLILYIIGIEFPFLIPLLFGMIVHLCFFFIVINFRSNHLKARGTV